MANNITISDKNTGDSHTAAEYNAVKTWLNEPSQSLGDLSTPVTIDGTGHFNIKTLSSNLELTFDDDANHVNGNAKTLFLIGNGSYTLTLTINDTPIAYSGFTNGGALAANKIHVFKIKYLNSYIHIEYSNNNIIQSTPDGAIVIGTSSNTINDDIMSMANHPVFLGSRWIDGVTYISAHKDSDLLLENSTILAYDENLGYLGQAGINDIQQYDGDHILATVWKGGNGKLYGCVEQTHIDDLDIYEFWNSDFSGWRKIDTISATTGAYPKAYTYGLKTVMGFRNANTVGGLIITAFSISISTDNQASWGAIVEVARIPAGEDGVGVGNYALYNQAINGGCPDNNGWYYILLMRSPSGNVLRYDNYVIKTQDFTTWYNIEETANFVPSTAPLEVNQTSAANYFVGASDNEATQCYQPLGCVDPDTGKIWVVYAKNSGNVRLAVNSGSGWTENQINIPNMEDDTNINVGLYSPVSVIWFSEETDRVYLIVRIDPLANNVFEQHLYYTDDDGATYTLVGNVFPDISASIGYCHVPLNMNEIPIERNFAVHGIEDFAGTSASYPVYINKLCKGNIQSETRPTHQLDFGDVTSGGVKLNWLTGRDATYYTLTGATITALTDKFLTGNDPTIVGTPQLSGTDMVFTASNTDAIRLTPSVMINRDYQGIAFLGKSIYVSASYITANGYHITLSVDSTTFRIQFATSLGNTFILDYAHSFSDNLKIGFFIIDGTTYRARLNGVFLDNPSIFNSAGTDDSGLLNTYTSNIAQLDRASVSLLDRPSAFYANNDFKDVAFYTNPLSIYDMVGLENKFVNDFGITLG